VALRVELVGGDTPPGALLVDLPLVSIYRDGRVITAGPLIAIYPGPALPNLLLQRISASDVDRLVEMALAAGVDPGADLGQPQVLDTHATRFTVLTDDGPRVLSAYALDAPGGALSGLTEAQLAARAALRDLRDDLSDLAGTLGADAVSEAEPYQATAIVAVARPWDDGQDGGDGTDTGLAEQPELAWPGPPLPGEAMRVQGIELHCVLASGDAAAEVLAQAQSANALTPWSSGGDRWTVSLRPLLPDESGCADLPAG
jgi:hypothetical protein